MGAIESANKTQVRLFGYGVYEGDFPRPDGTPGVFGTPEQMRETAKEHGIDPEALNRALCNPRIRLDNGSVVWGCQCWWGPEEKVKESIGGREVVIVPVPGTKNDAS